MLVHSISQCSWLVCIGADGKDRQYVIWDRNMLLCIAQDWPGMHNGWIQIPDNQGVAKHLALEITIRIAFCRGAWYGMCLHCSQVGPHWGPGSPWGPFSVFGSPFLFKVPIFSISGWRMRYYPCHLHIKGWIFRDELFNENGTNLCTKWRHSLWRCFSIILLLCISRN